MPNTDFKEMFPQDLDLCNAVVLNAVDDWREGMKYLYLHPNGQKKNIKFYEVCHAKHFILSDDFANFTSLDGSYLMRMLEKEFEEWKEKQNA